MPRRGLTLVELLAVIAIIGVLVGLLLPGVQSAREAARRSSCASNMRQLGQGLQQFHAARGSLPVTNATHPTYNVCNTRYDAEFRPMLQRLSGSDVYCVYTWMLGVLPHIGQQPLFDRFALREQWNSPNNKPLVRTPVPGFMCPSDPDSASPILPLRGGYSDTDAIGTSYAGSAGPAAVVSTSWVCNLYCRTSLSGTCWLAAPFPAVSTGRAGCPPAGAGVYEDPVLDKANRIGMFGWRYMTTSFDDVQDGLTNTFLVIETMPKNDVQNTAYNSGGNPVASLAAPINAITDPTASPFTTPPGGSYNRLLGIQWKSARSAHPGGSQMLMCDGAVAFFSELVPLELLCLLGNRKDGAIAMVP